VKFGIQYNASWIEIFGSKVLTSLLLPRLVNYGRSAVIWVGRMQSSRASGD
jgi:hypothetical protein